MGLRYGYTTGACAAAATKACCHMLKTGEIINNIDIILPIGKRANFKINNVEFKDGMAKCSVKKDAGDDPDVTNGIEIFSEVRITKSSGILIKGGEGVGLVTKPGLQVKVGEYAINPVPRKMIIEAVRFYFDSGIEVEISVPDGQRIARKTFNQKLGIIGGISIIGTTGIVKPFSLDSLKASIIVEINIACAMGFERLVLVPGNIGKSTAFKYYPFQIDQVVMISNFIGDMIIEASKRFKEIIIIGHPGKLIKLLEGFFNTHSKYSPSVVNKVKNDIKRIRNIDERKINRINSSTTVEGIIDLLGDKEKNYFFSDYATSIEKALFKFVVKSFKDKTNMMKVNKIGVGLNDMKMNIIGKGIVFKEMECELAKG